MAQPDLVVFEDYAPVFRGNTAFHVCELGGVLKTHTWEKGIDYVEINPIVMKSVIALKGNAEKPQIATALKVRFGLTVEQHDEADATGLMVLGEMKLGMRPPRTVEGKDDRFNAVRDAKITKGRLLSISKSP